MASRSRMYHRADSKLLSKPHVTTTLLKDRSWVVGSTAARQSKTVVRLDDAVRVVNEFLDSYWRKREMELQRILKSEESV